MCLLGNICDAVTRITCIDKDGNVYHGLSLDLYYDMHVKQADGIDIRRGCHDIVIEDIRGFAGDDLVALTCLDGSDLKNYSVEGMPDDLCNITKASNRKYCYD